MSKPLELLIHPKPQHRNHVTGGWLWDCEACNTVITGPSKRLTNAELAAEYESARCDALLVQATGHYWQSIECTWSQDTERVNERERTLIRFATLPHYDEVPE